MSVIYGKCYLGEIPPVAKVITEELGLMQASLNHWNADDIGTWHNDAVGLGHLMLYNTPESLFEKLPLCDSTGKVTITADARIDNRDELFEKLNIPVVEQRDVPDSSLILNTYEQYGEDCVLHLIGDFAFAIYDEKARKLFCARDHMGVKPFFYYTDNACFAFASEKKGIFSLPDIDKAINMQFFYNHLILFNDQPIDITLYKKIKRIPPAHTLTIDVSTNKLSLKRYWTLDAHKKITLNSNKQYYEQLLYHFEEAVKCRTRTAFPISIELSGGLDSSAITGAAQHFINQNNQHLITFSNTLPEDITNEQLLQSDEKKYIDEVIRFNNINEYVYVTETIWSDRLAEIDFGLYIGDGLESWTSGWLDPIKKAAMEKNVRTLLSGFPGDQMVTSLSKAWFLDLFHKRQYIKYVKATSAPGEPFNILSPLIPHKLKLWLKLAKDRIGLYDRHIRLASKIYKIPNKYKKNIKDYLWFDPAYAERLKSFRHWQKYILLKPMVAHRLESETRHGLYFKTEPRFPMADIRLTQFFSAMPNHLKYGGPLGRDFYRKTVEKYLPPLIQQRVGKYGSVAPFLKIQKAGSKDFFKLILSELPENKLLKKVAILKVITKIPSSNNGSKRSLPSLNLLRWFQKNPDALK